MAVFLGNSARIWSRFRSYMGANGAYSAFLWGEYFSYSWSPTYTKDLQMAVNAAQTKIAFHTNETYYTPIVNTSVAYSLNEVAYGRLLYVESYTQADSFWYRNSSGSGGTATSNVAEFTGLTNVNTAYPEWRLPSNPNSFSDIPWRWVGEWSDDESVFASVLVNPTTKELLLSVRQANNVTLTLRTPLGITHSSIRGRNGDDRQGTLPRVIVRSATDIWIFHTINGAYPNVNGTLYLSIWNGTAVTTTTLMALGPLNAITSFDVVDGDGAYMYITYTVFDWDFVLSSKIHLRTLHKSTKAVSAPLSTPDMSDGMEGYPGQYAHGRINSNRLFIYKGRRYIIAESSWYIAVFVYDADPSSVSLLRCGAVPPYTHPDFYTQTTRWQTCSNFIAIEYDPVADLAYLVVVVPSAIQELRPKDGTPLYDTTIIRVTVHHQRLSDTSWNMQATLANEIPGKPLDTSTSYSNRANFLESCGYVPSRTGTARTGTMLVSYHIGRSGGRKAYHEIIKVQLWSEPKIVDAELDPIDLSASVLAVGARDYRQAVSIDLSASVDVLGLLRRKSAWLSYYENTQSSYVSGAAFIDLSPTVSVFGNLTENHESSVLVDLSPQIYADAEIVTTTFFGYSYFSIGTDAVESFASALNSARVAEGVLALPSSTAGGRSLDMLTYLDVAQRHSNNEAFQKVYAHGSSLFPIGWQQTHQRLSRISYEGAEGLAILLAPVEYDEVDLSGAMSGCLAQMLMDSDYGVELLKDWGTQTEDVVLHLAYSVGPHPQSKGGGEPYDRWPVSQYPPETYNNPANLTIYVTCLLFVPKGIIVDTSFTHAWEVEALGLRLLEHSWSVDRLLPVVAVHEVVYGSPMHVEHAMVYRNSVTKWHEVSTTTPLIGYFEIDFTYSNPLPAGNHVAPYELLPRTVVSSHELNWSRTLATQHTLEYGEALRAIRAHDAPYGEFARLLASLSAPYGTPVPVSKSHGVRYAIQKQLRRAHAAPLLLGPAVKRGHAMVYDLQLRNPARRGFDVVYDLLHDSAGAVFLQPQSVAMLNGRSLEIDDGYITCDYESPGYTFECSVPDLEFIRGASIGDRLDVLFEGTPYVFFLSNLSSNTPERSAAEKVTIKGLSPVFALDAPYAETVTYAPDAAKLFSEIIQEALGLPVDFSRHIDWMVPYGRAQSASQTPLGLVKGFLESIGSRLLSSPDGSLYVLPRYPVGFDAIPSGVPPHALDETNNVFTRSSTYDYARGYNRFRVRDSDAGYGDMIEFDQDTSIATVWVSPYRTSWRLDCTLTPGVLLDAQGETVQEQEEVWDCQGGSANATYPILELVSLTWLTDSLGGVAFEPHSSKVSAPVTTNFGYGLAKVVYRTKCSKFLLTTSTPIEATQLIIVEL